MAGGVESISLVQATLNKNDMEEGWLRKNKPSVYLSMIATADIVVARYGISRADQDAFAAQSQERMAAAQDRGAFDDEIVAMDTARAAKDRETGKVSMKTVTLPKNDCNRPGTAIEGPDKFVTAGNASQLSACVVMDADDAARRGFAWLCRCRLYAG